MYLDKLQKQTLHKIYKLIKWIISLAALLFIFQKIKHASSSEINYLLVVTIKLENLKYFFAVFVLMFLNWFLESLKWKIIVSKLQKISIKEAIKGVLTGLSFGIVTPNRVGEVFGRILLIDDDKKLNAGILNFIGSAMQMSITLGFGLLSLLFYKENYFANVDSSKLLIPIILMGLAGIVVLFFCFSNIFVRQKLVLILNSIKEVSIAQLAKIFSLSILRYLVFSFQFLLILSVFNVQLSMLNSLVCIALNFLLVTIIPSYALAEIGIRGTVAVAVFSVYGVAALPVLCASFILWLINLAIPALLGSIVLLRE